MKAYFLSTKFNDLYCSSDGNIDMLKVTKALIKKSSNNKYYLKAIYTPKNIFFVKWWLFRILYFVLPLKNIKHKLWSIDFEIDENFTLSEAAELWLEEEYLDIISNA